MAFDTDDSDPQSADATGDAPQPPAGKLRYDDNGFLRLVRDERQRSVGFGEGDTGELERARIKAQEYRQGKLRDVPVLKGRSAAVDMSLAEAVDTIMPDVMEVFFGGDDVASFDAESEQDEPQAKQETEAVTWAIFSRNDAFRAFHDAIQDALLNRTGLFHWWWEEDTRAIGTNVAGSPVEAAMLAALKGQHTPWAQADVEQRDDGSIAITFAELRGKVCIKAVPSEDFTVAADTIALRDTAYCALRDRPRVQDLIARGIDAKVARELPLYVERQDAMERSRDTSGENDRAQDNGIDDLRVVEVRTHYLRVDADQDGEPELWRIETDAGETRLLQKEQVTHIPFGALTPYLTAHRFYGESLWDKLAEVQRIKTVLLRMLLDSGYFALNQRFEVGDDGSNEFTIADLLNNAPNVPVRSRTGEAVRPLSAGELSFDVFNAFEFMSTLGEQRSGVVRNAQGLNPDTLHDTASGAMQLIAAAQKRVRFIARIFCETGVKDLFLGVHRTLREQTTDAHAPTQFRRGAAWSTVQPQTWPARESLTVHVGAGDPDKNLQVQETMLELTEKVIEMQGGPNGPFVTPRNVYARLMQISRAAGERNAERFWSDPGNGPVGPPPGQGQNPEMAKVQAAAQAAAAKLQAEGQARAAEAQADQAFQQQKLAGELTIERQRMQQELALKREEMLNEIRLEREKAAQDIALQREEAAATVALKREEIAARVSSSTNVASAADALPGGPG